VSYELDIVCTGGGAHKRARLTKITFDDVGGANWRVGGGFYPVDSDEYESIFTRPDGKPSEVFIGYCGRCPRNFELRPEKFRYLVGALRRLGVSRLDISRLPF